ncbi:MAG: flagellar basal body-associated FliL family protein [Desulfofustis sp.]|nr:flagellar basal body-associated FliL family protein [Desulfofustis sp.]
MAEKPDKAKESPAKGKLNKKLIIMIIAAVIVLLIGGGVAAYLLLKNNKEDQPDDPGQRVPVPVVNPQSDIGPTVDIAEFVVNIISEQETHYVKSALTIELTNEQAKDEMNRRMPQVRDAILLLVSNKTFEELRDLQGKKQLKAELLSKINALMQSGQAKSIYFTEFVVQ